MTRRNQLLRALAKCRVQGHVWSSKVLPIKTLLKRLFEKAACEYTPTLRYGGAHSTDSGPIHLSALLPRQREETMKLRYNENWKTIWRSVIPQLEARSFLSIHQ